MADEAQSTPPDPAADAAAALSMRDMLRAFRLSPVAVLTKMREAEQALRLAAGTAYDHREDETCRALNEVAWQVNKLATEFGERHRRPEEPYGIY